MNAGHIRKNQEIVTAMGMDIPNKGKPIEPYEVANSMLYLGSEDASMVTGEVLMVDGAQSLTNDRFDDYSHALLKAYRQAKAEQKR